MARMTKAEKAIEKAVEASFTKLASGIQFDIMDLSKLSAAGKAAAIAGTSIDDAMKEAIAKYRKN